MFNRKHTEAEKELISLRTKEAINKPEIKAKMVLMNSRKRGSYNKHHEPINWKIAKFKLVGYPFCEQEDKPEQIKPKTKQEKVYEMWRRIRSMRKYGLDSSQLEAICPYKLPEDTPL